MPSIGEVVYSAEYCKNVLGWLRHPARVHSFRNLARRTRSKTVSMKEIDRSLSAWGLI